MPTRPLTSIAERLNTAKLAILNSLAEAEIRSLVASHGYTISKLNEGKALYEAAQAAVNAQKAAAGAQQESTQELLKAEKAARDVYQSLANIARAVFRSDRARLISLGLDGPRPRATAAFIHSASLLFDHAAGALTDYGYDAARLASEKAKVAAFDLANQKQEAAKGAAQQAGREQEAAMASLDAWRAQYVKIARVALRGKGQLLEKIGVTARTTKTAAQRAARRKKPAARGK